jgi:hypothetical protein
MSKGENMVERCARAVYERAETYPPYALSQMNGKMAEDFAIAVIEALMEPTPEMLASAEVGYITSMLEEEHNMAVAKDIFVSMLRTALSQPNDEGEGK